MRPLTMLLLGLTRLVADSSRLHQVLSAVRPRRRGIRPRYAGRRCSWLLDVDEINSVAQSFVANCYVESLWWDVRPAYAA
jgi:hypothetical protein